MSGSETVIRQARYTRGQTALSALRKQMRHGCFLLLCGMAPSLVEAHLMVAQRGTLNVVETGVFMVLSLPVSAFAGIDDNDDGWLSVKEFTQHQASIRTAVERGVSLSDHDGPLLLQGLMLTPSPPDTAPPGVENNAAKQIVIMGRFALRSVSATDVAQLIFNTRLFGHSPDEQVLQIGVTYPAQGWSHSLNLSASRVSAALYSRAQPTKQSNKAD